MYLKYQCVLLFKIIIIESKNHSDLELIKMCSEYLQINDDSSHNDIGDTVLYCFQLWNIPAQYKRRLDAVVCIQLWVCALCVSAYHKTKLQNFEQNTGNEANGFLYHFHASTVASLEADVSGGLDLTTFLSSKK